MTAQEELNAALAKIFTSVYQDYSEYTCCELDMARTDGVTELERISHVYGAGSDTAEALVEWYKDIVPGHDATACVVISSLFKALANLARDNRIFLRVE